MRVSRLFCKHKWAEIVRHSSNGRANGLLSMDTSLFLSETVQCSESEDFFQHKLNHQSPYSSDDSVNLMRARVWITGFMAYFLFSLAPLVTMYFTPPLVPFLLCAGFKQMPCLFKAASLFGCLYFCMEGRVFQLAQGVLTVSHPLCCPLA